MLDGFLGSFNIADSPSNMKTDLPKACLESEVERPLRVEGAHLAEPLQEAASPLTADVW